MKLPALPVGASAKRVVLPRHCVAGRPRRRLRQSAQHYVHGFGTETVGDFAAVAATSGVLPNVGEPSTGVRVPVVFSSSAFARILSAAFQQPADRCVCHNQRNEKRFLEAHAFLGLPSGCVVASIPLR